MTLRKKTLIIIGITLICLIVVLYATSSIILSSSVAELYFMLSFLTTGLVFSAVILLLLEKLVLSRLTRLSTKVSEIGAEGDLSARVSMTGTDELSDVAFAINGMLAALERSQHEMRENEKKFRSIVRQSADGIVLADEQGEIIEWNQGEEQITGLERSEVLGLLLWDIHFRTVPGELKVAATYKQIEAGWLEFFKVGKLPWRNGLQERDIIRPDGTRRTVQTLVFPIKTDKGWMACSISRDITERKRAEEELSQRLQEQETLFAIGQLVSSSLQIDEVMRLVAEYMARLVDAAGCAISDWDVETGTLTVRAQYLRPDCVNLNDPIEDLGKVRPISEYPAQAVTLCDRKPFVVYKDDPKATLQERQFLALYRWRGVAGIPLVVQERLVGLIEVYLAGAAQFFSEHDLRLMQALADQVAIAIENARLFATVQASEVAMRNLSLRLIDVQEKERRRIAQELHDELGQILTATKINVDLARRKLSQVGLQENEDVVVAQSRMDEASALTDEVLTQVRSMTIELRPTLLDDMGIVPTLRSYLARFAERTGIQAQLGAPELPARLRAEIETTIYRVVKEALTNVARHAQANQVWVQLTCSDDVVTVSVEDDGQGFDVKAWSERRGEQQTLGLTGIQERVMLLDGRVEIRSQPVRGTRVEIELPARFRSENER